MLATLFEHMVNGCISLIPRSKPTLAEAQAARLIAHRGAHYNAQGIIENTLDAFFLAQKTGCWGIELDVRATADKILVINHDPTIKRLWGHDIAIADLSFHELRALAPKIPTLVEVVTEFGQQMHLFIELKAPFHDEAVLVNVLQGLSAVKDYHLLTLRSEVFSTLSQFPKEALLLVASYNNVAQFCHLSTQEHYGGVLGHYLLLINSLSEKLKEANQQVGVGFVDSKNSLYRALTRGINWVFSNQVIEVHAHLQTLLDED